MLAVHRPRMGSSKPPNLVMPFGYSFDDPNTNYPFPSPAVPAPGQALLDDNESRFLDSFFDGVSTDTFNYDFYSSAPNGSEIGLGWEELPPAFMGTSSSFGKQPQLSSHGLPASTFHDSHPPLGTAEPSIPATTTADVLAAANLLQNGPAGRTQSIGNGAFFGGQETHQSTNGQMRAQTLSQYQAPRSSLGTTSDDLSTRDTLFAEMMFGNPNPEPPTRPRLGGSKDIRWGSDARFGNPLGFGPGVTQRENQAEVSALERYHQKVVENAFIETSHNQQSSADTTRPSSPTLTHTVPPHLRAQIGGPPNDEEDSNSRPRKRRKSKYEGDEDDDESPASATKPSSIIRKRKPTKKGDDSPLPTSEQNTKRRKSAAAANAAAKTARENLTEDQKRENHIKSEQKRRTLIREGFEDLGELVPGLRGGGFSKSAVLHMAADWLEELLRGNEGLRRQLDTLQGRG